MARKTIQNIAGTDPYTITPDGISKKLALYSADTKANAIGNTYEQTYFSMSPIILMRTMTRFAEALTEHHTYWDGEMAQLYTGYVRQVMGATFPHKSVLEDLTPGQPITYIKSPYPRITQDFSGKEKWKFTATVDVSMEENAGVYANWSSYRDSHLKTVQTIAESHNLIKNVACKAFFYSFFPGCSAIAEAEMAPFIETSIQPDDDYSKQAKKFFTGTTSGEPKDMVKKIVEETKNKIKNYVTYDPTLLNVVPAKTETEFKKDGNKVTYVTDANACKTQLKGQYVQSAGQKSTMYKDLNRKISILGLAHTIKEVCSQFLNVCTPRNLLGFNPDDTSNANDNLFPMTCPAENLVIVLNNFDYMELMEGFKNTSPYGQYDLDLKKLIDLGARFFALPGIPPGHAKILDRRAFAIVPYFSTTSAFENTYRLLVQYISHLFFRVTIFNNYCGLALIPEKFVPAQLWIKTFMPKLLA